MNKSRGLSIYEYFKQLQLEYIITELRRKIYPLKRDKDFYKRVMKGKEKKINDISLRNSLPSIFNNDEIKNKYYNQIYQKVGFPNFIYKDERDKEKFEELDKKFYYLERNEFKITLGQEIKVGILISISFVTNTATLQINGEKESSFFAINYITRIL